MVVRNSVLLDNLPNLPSLVGLPALTNTGGLRVHGTGVTTLAGLEALERIDTSLTIDANPALTSLAGLDSLARIDGDLVITANPLLVDLAGEALTVVGGGVQIRGNESLGDDTANAWLEHLTVVRGAVDIAGNGP